MSRKRIKVLATVVALGCFVAGATFARSNIANSAGGQADMTKVDLDRPIAEAIAMPRRESMPTSMPTFMAMVDLDQVVAHATGAPRRESTPAMVAMVDFDHAFHTTAALRPENTPPNREKLRNAGWQRILG